MLRFVVAAGSAKQLTQLCQCRRPALGRSNHREGAADLGEVGAQFNVEVFMLKRFVAATAIAAVGVACGALAIVLVPNVLVQRSYPLPLFWCFAPLTWGIWAMLAPSSWVPRRLPIWGTILGLIAGSLAAFVLNMPSRILGQTVSAAVRGVGVVVIGVFYYFLWMLVRAVYRALSPTDSGAPKPFTTAA
jgi:hypothetical protein